VVNLSIGDTQSAYGAEAQQRLEELKKQPKVPGK